MDCSYGFKSLHAYQIMPKKEKGPFKVLSYPEEQIIQIKFRSGDHVFLAECTPQEAEVFIQDLLLATKTCSSG